MQIIQPPRVEQRPEKAYVGIRVVTPFRGMLRARDELLRSEEHTSELQSPC